LKAKALRLLSDGKLTERLFSITSRKMRALAPAPIEPDARCAAASRFWCRAARAPAPGLQTRGSALIGAAKGKVAPIDPTFD
jgi:hypothetical protein